MSTKHGEVSWNELNTRDVAKAKAYYEAVCGWKFETMDMGQGDYHIAKVGDQMVAGMMDVSGFPGLENTPPHWLMYIETKSVDDAVAETRAQGGTVYRDAFDIEGVGRIAIVADPSGAALGLMTSSG